MTPKLEEAINNLLSILEPLGSRVTADPERWEIDRPLSVTWPNGRMQSIDAEDWHRLILMSVEKVKEAMAAPAPVRLLRLIEYVGDRNWIDRQISQRGVKGRHHIGGHGYIQDALLGETPEILIIGEREGLRERIERQSNDPSPDGDSTK